MPGIVYRAGVKALRFGASLYGFADRKARARLRGAATALATLPATSPATDCYWMHCASVGEFEQGRPVWEAIRALRPNARFVLSFFSPSGVEWFGERDDVGEVVYLPWDIGGEPARFVERLSPKLALFVKYEWWLGYHEALRQQGTPTVLFSVAFRQNQPFFRPRHPLHSDYRAALSGIGHVFVQTEASRQMLLVARYSTPVSVAGDTRLDRTLVVRDSTYEDVRLASWAARSGPLLVVGSSWPPDEIAIARLLEDASDLYVLCAPHEVDDGSRRRLLRTFAKFDPLLYSDHAGRETVQSRVMILDAKGVLAKAYRYGDLAYVGGGFGAGIHNTLEPMVYGLPLAFGPRYRRFDEAIALVDAGIAYVCPGHETLLAFVQRFGDEGARRQVLAKAEAYVAQHRGATAAIIEYLAAERLL